MELWQEILGRALQKEAEESGFSEIDILSRLLDSECYRALKRIKDVIEDDTLEDADCFMKIEEIVCIFEKLGSHGKNRHDFG